MPTPDYSHYVGLEFRPEGETLAVGRLPGRASYALYVQHGAVCTPLAYFRSEDAAGEACRLLSSLTGRVTYGKEQPPHAAQE